MSQGKCYVYISSWNFFGGEPGLGLYEFDQTTGDLKFQKMISNELSCGVTYADQEKDILYIVNEVGKLPEMRDGGGGRVFGYKVNRQDGDLTEVCHVPTFCPNPAGLTLDEEKEYLVVANHSGRNAVTKVRETVEGKYEVYVEYDDATVNLYKVNGDGTLGELKDVVKHHGSGPGPAQAHPHPHSAVKSPSGKLYAVCDKGNDSLYLYKIDREKEKLCLMAEPYKFQPGMAPRRCVFHPTLPYIYVNFESALEIACLSYTEDGNLQLADLFFILNEGTEIPKGLKNEQQGLVISKDGKYIYDVVHNPEVLAVFEVDEKTGKPILIQNVKVNGVWPRECAISPNGSHLLLSCLKSGQVLVYQIDKNGKLSDTEKSAEQSAAAFVTFYSGE